MQPSGADQAEVTLGNVDGEIASLTISDPPTQAEDQAVRDACEELADGRGWRDQGWDVGNGSNSLI